MSLRGADPETVRRALSTGNPLPGTAGFAGGLDGRLVRDVLGRHPVFYDGAGEGAYDWGFDPRSLDDPVSLPAGHLREGDSDREVWSLPDPTPSSAERAQSAVTHAVLRSVREAGDSDGNVAVAFSGGVDSGLVAHGLPEAPLYVVGFEGCHDIEAARVAADAMERTLRVVALTHADIERAVPELVRATGRTNAMDIQIALPLYLVAERAAADGYDRLAVGQGADELFGGYAKVRTPAEDRRVEADTVRGATREVVATLPDQLERDVLALRAAGVEPVVPLLHDRVVDAALRLPGGLLATESEGKVALRRAAADVLPECVVDADKKAVQYGSYVAREVDRLARQAGFKRRMDDHVRRYIESLAE